MSITTAEIIENIKFKAAQQWELRQRDNPRKIWELAQTHRNPEILIGWERENWPGVWVNFNADVIRPEQSTICSLEIADGSLSLSTGPDPEFKLKSHKWREGLAAVPAYNNIYTLSRGDWLPTPKEDILITSRMTVDWNTAGSTGIWMHSDNVFNPETGVMEKPFRSFGFSFVGKSSCEELRGLAAETAVGFAWQELSKIKNVDPFERHTYQMLWYWQDQQRQAVDFWIDGDLKAILPIHPFGPAQSQLWHDNYWFPKKTEMNFRNPDKVYQTEYDSITIKTVARKQ